MGVTKMLKNLCIFVMALVIVGLTGREAYQQNQCTATTASADGNHHPLEDLENVTIENIG